MTTPSQQTTKLARSFSAILIVSRDPKRLADFYRDALGIPLGDEQHDDTDLHYGYDLEGVHFAIHPRSNFEQVGEPETGAVNMAFAIGDAQALVASVRAAGYNVEYEPKDLGWCIMTAVRDPDGNYIEFTQFDRP
jgi:catechol 2,3-dioxygenase-like lactoylglutathione lyase family enzyme